MLNIASQFSNEVDIQITAGRGKEPKPLLKSLGFIVIIKYHENNSKDSMDRIVNNLPKSLQSRIGKISIAFKSIWSLCPFPGEYTV